jgi:predicted RNA binding protein YcfA (HicA-like mRNA interferase family)
VPKVETNARKIVARLEREGWTLLRHGGDHDVYRHPRAGLIAVPRYRQLTVGTRRSIAKKAGWL